MNIPRTLSIPSGLHHVDSMSNHPVSPSENQDPQQNQKVRSVASSILKRPNQEQVGQAAKRSCIDKPQAIKPFQGPPEESKEKKVDVAQKKPAPLLTQGDDPFQDPVEWLKEKTRFEALISSPAFRAKHPDRMPTPPKSYFHLDSSSAYLRDTIGYKCITALNNGKLLP
ncbi:MAG: hypothetical protein WCG14_07720 [Chlamydiia bacterium]